MCYLKQLWGGELQLVEKKEADFLKDFVSALEGFTLLSKQPLI